MYEAHGFLCASSFYSSTYSDEKTILDYPVFDEFYLSDPRD